MLAACLWATNAAAQPALPRLDLADSVVAEAATIVRDVQLDGRSLPFDALASTAVEEGEHTLSFAVDAAASGARLLLAPCAGKVQPAVKIDGAEARERRVSATGQRLDLAPGKHTVELTLTVSTYERRIACGAPPRVGPSTWSFAGLRTLHYASNRSGGNCERCRPGQALVYVPRIVAEREARGDTTSAPLLLGLHPWKGAIETYAAYTDLLEAAEREGVIVLLADGLGNSLYRADAEAEVMDALDAATQMLHVDADRISLFGASMGGAGATTVGFHHPDRFATLTSLFGDSKYDLSTYVRRLLPTEADAAKVNALDVVENARNLPVVLVHGDADISSKIEQSEILDRAMRERGFSVRFDRKPGRGHEGRLVSEYAADIAQRTAKVRRVAWPTRVSYRSVRDGDVGAYGVNFRKSAPRSFVDVEYKDGEILVHSCAGISTITLHPRALGASPNTPVRFAAGVAQVPIVWAP